MTERRQGLYDPGREGAHPDVDGLHSHGVEKVQPDLHGREARVVEGSVLETLGAGRESVALREHRSPGDGSPGEPRAVQLLQGRAACQECPHARWVSEHLVEREGDVVRVPPPQVEAIRGHISGGVQEHVPLQLLGLGDPFQWMLDAGEVGLGRIGEKLPPGLAAPAKELAQGVLRHPHVRGLHGYVAGDGLSDPVEGPDPDNGVVVVEGEQETIPGLEGVGLAHQLQGTAGVGSEDQYVLLRIRVEELQDPPPAS